MLDENDTATDIGKPDKQEKVSTTSFKKADMDTIQEDEEEDEVQNRNEPIIKLTNVTALWEEFEPVNNDENVGYGTQFEDNKITDVSTSYS